MQKTTQKLFLFTIAVMGMSIASAQVLPNGVYAPIGNTVMTKVFDDADNGDGVGDGAYLFDGKDTTPDLGAVFSFNGTIKEGETYEVATYVYNTGNSYVDFYVVLHNQTKGTDLAVSDRVVVQKSDPAATLVELSYVGLASDAGDKIQLIFERIELNAGRDFKVDNISLNGTFVAEVEALDAVSSAGAWGIVDSGFPYTGPEDGPTILKIFGDDPAVKEGSILVDGKNSASGNNQGAKFTLEQTMTAGTRYKAETDLYNPRLSYVNVKIQLYNVTDDRVLATSGRIGIAGAAGGVAALASGSVSYIAIADDAGDVLEIRWLRDDGGNTARDFGISKAMINYAELNTATLSIKNNEFSQGISIYPNPSNSLLNIKTSANVTIKNVALVDVTGKEVFRQNNAQSIDVRSFAKGLYILKIESQEGAVTSKKVLVN